MKRPENASVSEIGGAEGRSDIARNIKKQVIRGRGADRKETKAKQIAGLGQRRRSNSRTM